MSVWFITGASVASVWRSPVKRSAAATRSPPPPAIPRHRGRDPPMGETGQLRPAWRSGQSRDSDYGPGRLRDLPERIQLGQDCFTAVAQKFARTAHDQAHWREISMSTGYRA